MESKHTPGHWTSNYDDNGFYVVQDVGTGEDLLTTPNEYAGDKAVAELASYAPEMLEALEWILQISETVDLKQPVDVEQTINGIKQMTRKQIDKAKGGKQ